jgi:hypothetical protein
MALRMSFSLPATCSQAESTGKGFSPAKRALSGCTSVGDAIGGFSLRDSAF